MKTKNLIEHSQKTLGAAFASSILAAALIAVPTVATAGSSADSKERCADVVKGGKNSCAVKSLGISCQGSASEDNTAGAWIKVPAGTCGNIVNICAGTADAPEGVSAEKVAKTCGKIADQEEGIAGGRVVDANGEAVESSS